MKELMYDVTDNEPWATWLDLRSASLLLCVAYSSLNRNRATVGVRRRWQGISYGRPIHVPFCSASKYVR